MNCQCGHFFTAHELLAFAKRGECERCCCDTYEPASPVALNRREYYGLTEAQLEMVLETIE